MYARWRTAALLAVVLIGLIGLSSLLQAQRFAPPAISRSANGTVIPTDTIPDSGELFPTVALDAIDQMTIAPPLVTYQKSGDSWHEADATGTLIPVDPANMVRAITILSTLRYNRRLEDVNVAQFGLSGQAQHEIDFTAGGVTHRLRIGTGDQFSGSYYMQRDDDPAVYVVDSGKVALLYTSLAVSTPTPSAADGTSAAVGTATP